MADHTAYPDWIDCRDLRAAEQAAGRGDDSSGVNGVWRSTLRLIDPEDDAPAAKVDAKAAAKAIAGGADILRVHDGGAIVQTARMADALWRLRQE